MMFPKTTWPTSRGSMPARLTASRTHSAASSLGGESFRLPPYPPIAVRAPLRTTTSRVVLIAGPFERELKTHEADLLVGRKQVRCRVEQEFRRVAKTCVFASHSG